MNKYNGATIVTTIDEFISSKRDKTAYNCQSIDEAKDVRNKLKDDGFICESPEFDSWNVSTKNEYATFCKSTMMFVKSIGGTK